MRRRDRPPPRLPEAHHTTGNRLSPSDIPIAEPGRIAINQHARQQQGAHSAARFDPGAR